MGEEELIIRQLSQKEDPVLYSQVLHLRNQLLRLPIGLDLFQEDLSQEEHHVTLAAIITPAGIAKLNGNNSTPPSSSTTTTNSKDITKTNEMDEEGRTKQEEKAVGCIILAPLEEDDKTFKVRQMAVSPEFQGQGLGSKLVDSAESFARLQGKARLALHGRKHAVGFYLKKGFNKISEQEFLELGIPHYALEKNL